MKKAILIIILFIIMMLSGCIFNLENNGNGISYATKGDLELAISMDNEIYSLNSSEIQINIRINNVGTDIVYLSSLYKSEHTNIYLLFQNKTLIPAWDYDNYEQAPTPIKIEKSSKVTYVYNILDYKNWFDKSTGESSNDFPKCGFYKIYLTLDLQNEDCITSNELEFGITS